ncbi:MAG: CvpA family protein [Candidatus Pelagibacter sp. TMED165]|nr:MAG: CvpA family protein [Candidatus Pelagibacter sp. TMED165]|tara:strand:+ start:35 stop:580 length:546 start_codon:yes stop_codon:yes gene_type:complete
MLDILKDFYEIISIIDLICLLITILSVLKCYRKGFVLSILAASKWILAYIVTLIFFPKIKPYFSDIIDSEYVLDIVLGLSIFVLVIFIILMINKGIGAAIKYSGIGRLDYIFGFFFGFIRAYVICIIVFSVVNIIYNYNKWPINTDKSFTFTYLKKGSNYLIKEFPNEKKYKDSKQKIEEL